MAKSSHRLKLSKNMKPYVGRVVRGGLIQEAFGEQIGKTVGACVSQATKGKVAVLSGSQIHRIATNCAKQYKGKQLSGPFIHNGPGAREARARRHAGLEAG